MTREKNHTFQMRVAPGWLTAIDEWRRGEADIPSRAEAIRHLTVVAIEAIPVIRDMIAYLESQAGDGEALATADKLRNMLSRDER